MGSQFGKWAWLPWKVLARVPALRQSSWNGLTAWLPASLTHLDKPGALLCSSLCGIILTANLCKNYVLFHSVPVPVTISRTKGKWQESGYQQDLRGDLRIQVIGIPACLPLVSLSASQNKSQCYPDFYDSSHLKVAQITFRIDHLEPCTQNLKTCFPGMKIIGEWF